jgi:histidinol-phosphate aminotransferase
MEDPLPFVPRYQPGATGPRPADVAELASNESPSAPSPHAVAAAARVLARGHRYPDPTTGLLRARLAAEWSVSPDEVLVSPGTTALIDLVARTLVGRGRSAVVSECSFLAYAASVAASGGTLLLAPMRRHAIDLAAVHAAVRTDTRVVFLANPNNPTGTAFDRATFDAFLAELPPRVLVVLDEAYAEYAAALGFDLPDGVAAVRAGRPVLVLRTFSKVYGLAGLRVGYGIGPRAVVEDLRARAPLFGVSDPAEAAALAALDDADHVARVVGANAEGLRALSGGLRALGYAPPVSVANFVLVDVGRPADEVRDALLARGVRVRSLAGWGAPTAIRVTVGSPAEVARLLAALGRAHGGVESAS